MLWSAIKHRLFLYDQTSNLKYYELSNLNKNLPLSINGTISRKKATNPHFGVIFSVVRSKTNGFSIVLLPLTAQFPMLLSQNIIAAETKKQRKNTISDNYFHTFLCTAFAFNSIIYLFSSNSNKILISKTINKNYKKNIRQNAKYRFENYIGFDGVFSTRFKNSQKKDARKVRLHKNTLVKLVKLQIHSLLQFTIYSIMHHFFLFILLTKTII